MYNKKLWIIVFILIVAIILLVGFAALNPNKPVTYILESFMNSQQILTFNEIATKCGFRVKSITRDDSLDGLDGDNTLGFRIETQYKGNVILYIKDGNVKSIRFADNYLYNDGNFLGILSDYLK